MAAVEVLSQSRPQLNLWHEVHLLENSVNVYHSNCPTQCYSAGRTPRILLIAGVDGICVGRGLGRKGGNARIGGEGGMQYR